MSGIMAASRKNAGQGEWIDVEVKAGKGSEPRRKRGKAPHPKD